MIFASTAADQGSAGLAGTADVISATSHSLTWSAGPQTSPVLTGWCGATARTTAREARTMHAIAFAAGRFSTVASPSVIRMTDSS